MGIIKFILLLGGLLALGFGKIKYLRRQSNKQMLDPAYNKQEKIAYYLGITLVIGAFILASLNI